MKSNKYFLSIVLSSIFLFATLKSDSLDCQYKIINILPHNSEFFTQGLVYHEGVFFEGTGGEGYSALYRVDPKTGKILFSRSIADNYFGEGITLWQDKIIQLTWLSHIGFVYEKESFTLLQQFNYDTEGWGITHNNKYLIMSDGTNILHFLDPDNLFVFDNLEVTYNDKPLKGLNELEYIKGKIFANVWPTNYIVIIDPESGKVERRIDLSGLLVMNKNNQKIDVLNGIAYNKNRDCLYITGKFWPKIFEIQLDNWP